MAALTGKRRRAPLTESGSVVAVRVDISQNGNMRTWATIEGVIGVRQAHFGRAGQSTIDPLLRSLQYQMGQEWFQRKFCGRDTEDAKDEILRLARKAMEGISLGGKNWRNKNMNFLNRLKWAMEREYPGKTDNIYIRNDLIDHKVLAELVRQKQNDQKQANLSPMNFPALGAAASVQTPARAPSLLPSRMLSGQVKQDTIGAATQIEMIIIGQPHIHVFLQRDKQGRWINVNEFNISECLGMVRTTRFAPADSRNDKRFKGLQTRKNLTTPKAMERVRRAIVTPRMDPMEEEDEEDEEHKNMAVSAAGKNGFVDMFENLTF